MRTCFFAPVKDASVLTYNQFYAQDIRILREISSDVRLCTRASEIRAGADLYFIWWWSWAFLPLAFATIGRKPSIITGTFDLENPIRGAGYFTRPLHQRLLMKTALSLATTNLFVSQLEYERVPETLRTRSPRFVPHVIDGDLHPYRGREGREPFLLTICWMSGLNPERKGVDIAIRAHAQLVREEPAIELYIAGAPGDAKARLERLVAELGTAGHVRFLGRVDESEKVRLLQTCQAYLQPSVFEGFGVAAAEAVACGAPVIATRVGALPEVLGEDTVWVDERTPEGVADAVRRLRRDFSDERRQRAADRIRAKFSYQRRRDGIVEAVRDASSGRPRNP